VRALIAPDARIFVYIGVLIVLNDAALWAMRTHLHLSMRVAMLVTVMPVLVFLIIMLLHEILHGNASRSVVVNCIAQGAVTAIGAMPIRGYQVLHKMHHAYLNTRLDLEYMVAAPLLFRALTRVSQPIGIGLYAICYRRDVLRRAVRGNHFSMLASMCVAVLGAAARVRICGWSSLLELYVVMFLVFSAHPVNSRSHREHVFPLREHAQPTMSSYAPATYALSAGVSLHVEHHDFPDIPSTRASELARIAPSF
jgi:sphingolipid delta-4 desaturase